MVSTRRTAKRRPIYPCWDLGYLGIGCSGKKQIALELLHWLNPILRGSNKKDTECYMVEPTVVAADVYSKVPPTGCGRWTWYTGSLCYPSNDKNRSCLEVNGAWLYGGLNQPFEYWV